MSISVAERNQRTVKRYIGLFLFAIVFAAVYESFSHHVLSLWMIVLPLFPLLLGVLPFLVLKNHIPEGWARQFWHCGVATCMTGSCLTGIFEIAGTKMPYTVLFLLVGTVLLAVSAFLLRFSLRSDVEDGRHIKNTI